MTKEERANDYAEHNIDKYTNKYANICDAYLKGAEEETMELEERIHTLEVYLEGAINFLILNGDVDNPIIKSVENILHITFNKNWR